jgi:phospholipase/carboxylesterase
MKSRILLPLCLLLCLVACAQQPAYVYKVREPLPTAGASPAPLLLLLHGYGANVDDLFSFAADLPADYRIVSLQAPIDLGHGQFAWYPLRFEGGRAVADESRAQAAVDYIHGFIDFLKANYKVDAQRIYCMGFSQGTILSYAVALMHPGEIRGVVGFSGRMLASIRPAISADERHKALRVFVTHGTEDQVIPLASGQEAVTYLQGLGVQPTFKTYRAGHTILPEMMHDMLGWLAEDAGLK